MLLPALLAVVTLVVWMTVAVSDRIWSRMRLLPVRLHHRRR